MGTLQKRSVPDDVWNSSSNDEESLSDSSSVDSDSDYSDLVQGDRRQESDSDYRDSDQEGRRSEKSRIWRTLHTLESRGRARKRKHDLWRENKIRLIPVNTPRSPSPLPNSSGNDVDVVNGSDADRDSRSSSQESNIRSSSRESFHHYSISSSSSRTQRNRSSSSEYSCRSRGSEPSSESNSYDNRGRQSSGLFISPSRSRSRSRSRSFSPHHSPSSSDLSAAESDDSDIQIIEGPIRDTGRGSKIDREISATFPHQGEDDRHEDERDHLNGVRREYQGSSNRREEVYSRDDAQVTREWLPVRQNAQGLAEENRSPYRQAQSQQTSSSRQANHTGMVTIDVENSTRRALNEIRNGEGSSSNAENCQSLSPLKQKRTESAGDTCDNDYSDNKQRKWEPAESPLNATSSASPTNSSHPNRREPCTTEHQPRNQRSNFMLSSVNSQWTFHPVALPEHSAMDTSIENYHVDNDLFVNTPPRNQSPLPNPSGSDVNVVNGFDADRDSTDWIYERYYRRLYQSRHSFSRDHSQSFSRESNFQSPSRESNLWSPSRKSFHHYSISNGCWPKPTSSSRQANHTGMVTIDVENSTRRALNEIGNGEGNSSNAENCQSCSPLKRKRTESAGDTCDNDYSDNKRRKREPAESPLNATSSASPTNSSHQHRREPCTTEHQPSHSTLSSVNSQWTFHPVALPELSAMDVENYLNHLDSDHSIELESSPEGSDMTSSSVYDLMRLYLPDESWYQDL